MTRTSSAVPTKTTKTLLAELAANGIPALRTHLNERVAYRALFERRCSLTELDPSVVNGVPQERAGGRSLFFAPEGPGFVRLTVVDGKGKADSVMVRLQ